MEPYAERADAQRAPRPEIEERLAGKMAEFRACNTANLRRRQRRLNAMGWIIRAALPAEAIAFAWLWVSVPLSQAVSIGILPVLVTIVTAAVYAAELSTLRQERAEADRAMQAIIRETDPRIAGLLAAAHRDGDPSTRTVLAPILRDRLAQLRASDLPAFTAEDIEAILALLRVPNLVLTALPAIAELAPAGAVREVLDVAEHQTELFADSREKSLRPRNGGSDRLFSERVRIALERCLGALKDREAADASRNRLLRPAEGAEPGRLLRPAGAGMPDEDRLPRPASLQHTPPERLLRPRDE